MRRSLLLLLGLLVLHQSGCFEFVIDGEWEDEEVSLMKMNRASASACRFPNGRSSLTSPCEPRLIRPQDLETFNTEVHVPPGSNIEFELHYQEMMERKLGLYEHFLYLEPGRLVPQFQVSDLHFVHFFAPSNLSPLPKNIVFVIDVSGSMWGVKMKQTVEAMKAILDDLNIEDRFSIIDFNHNVRCWSEDLVPASSLRITDAKRYIQNIKPNGAQMLVRASNQGFIDSSSVSMIILVSDGDPTVGEIKLSKIQKNVKRVMTEEFSLFSLGIGFDVDYDFLERIAMENRGMAQRIYANHDAAEQIRSFYSQVSSPLLKKVTIHFPEGTVTEVTQNYFDKYFSGSELVVAGKVQLSESNTLTSITSASAASLQFSLQTDADMTELDTELAKQQHSFTGFAKQMWAYLTVKQLIRERSLAATVGIKRRITKQITDLALQHSFVTPLTALLVESEDGTERLLADSPRDPRQGCCTDGVVFVPVLDHLPGPVPFSSRSGRITNIQHLIMLQGFRLLEAIMLPSFLPSLLSSGVVVNGQLISSKQPRKSKLSTYFGIISVYYQPEGVSVTVSTDQITMTDGRNSHSFTWGATAEITQDGNKKLDFTGQFSREPEVSVYDIHEGPDPLKDEATMEVKGNTLLVTRGWQKDYRDDKKRGSNIYCWFIHNSAKGFIDGHYTDYILPDLNSFLQTV
ncbi:hypothetical protein GOODEAATRI_019005 [Goodea atripinnis]|uniref:VWFA domain-containing protein n=1 Tax=Goodea atripinnis TaxID=208336 RepID=A0ABV0MTG1_9TELE